MPLRFTISVLVALGLLMACGGGARPSDAPGSVADPERLATTTRTGTDVLGPYGWRGLNLRMTQARAITTGLLGGRTGSPMPCQRWSTTRSDTIDNVFISQRLGVAAIAGAQSAPVYTPEGMTIGWTLDQVTQTYAGVSPEVQGENLRFVPVPNNAKARYRVGFDRGGRVSALTLELVGQDCYD
jgi:hypothetical protein